MVIFSRQNVANVNYVIIRYQSVFLIERVICIDMRHTFLLRFHSFESEIDGFWLSYNRSIQQVLMKKKKLNILHSRTIVATDINSQLIINTLIKRI